MIALAALAALSITAPSFAQDRAPGDVAAEVHEEGGYPSGIVLFHPEEGDSARGAEGAHQAPPEVSIDRERAAGDSGQGDSDSLRWLREILEAIGSMLGAVGHLGWVFLIALVVLLAMAVGYLIVRLRFPTFDSATQATARAESGALDPMLMAPGESPEALAAAGRYAEAIHALFVSTLVRAGMREHRFRGRTAREVVDTLARDTAHQKLSPLLGMTELVWFGGRPADESQYLSARALAADVATPPLDDGPIDDE